MYKTNKTNNANKINTVGPEQKYNILSNKINILIVDDDQLSRDSLRDILQLRGHNITTIDEGMKCINRCSENKYDIIFMDYHMDILGNDLGEVDGAAITKLIKECFNIKSSIYAYTGDNSKTALDTFKQNNMKGAFIKPVEPELMLEFIKLVENKADNNNQLLKLSMKKKNFIYFKK